MLSVEIYNWREGFKKVSCTKLLQERAGMGLAKAKNCTDRILDRQSVRLVVESLEAANRLVSGLKALGADARILKPETDA
jgi:ribosomal protein L7/L12